MNEMLPCPPGWRAVPLWSLFERVKDTGHPDMPMLSVFREHGVVRKDSLPNLNQTAENRNIYQLVGPGWLVVNRMKAWQGSVGIAREAGIVSGHYLCFRPRSHGQDDDFLNLLLRSAPYAAVFQALSRGVRPGQAEIDNDALQVVPILLPGLEEQRRMADQVALLDHAINLRQQQIALLSERKQALIAAVLTGQFDLAAAQKAAKA